MSEPDSIFIGGGEKPCDLLLKLANRHGLIAGATGTGKTVTLQILAEGFSRLGVPVFLADVKGDLGGLSQPGVANPKFAERAKSLGLTDYRLEASPVMLWDVLGEQGHPVRTTVSEMGPLLLSRLLDLTDAQEGVLSIVFQIADDEKLLLLDLKDLQALLSHVADNAKTIGGTYGNVSAASVGTIQRKLLTLKQQGGDHFFGEPALDLNDFMKTAQDGRGFINILAADKLMQTPMLYATFLLWMLSELFETLPEVGDPDKPKLVFFFDEAHLLFDDAPKALLDRIESVVRLIRSKGVGIYFATQNPLDVPDSVLGQLGNRVQHALRAFTPRDQKAVRAAAETFRANPAFEIATVITELGVGEALVSCLEGKGTPAVVERAFVRPPSARLGPISPDERRKVIAGSPVAGKYDREVDRESAYETLSARTQAATSAGTREGEAADSAKAAKNAEREAARPAPRGRETATEAFAKSVMRSVGSQVGRQLTQALVRGILGSLTK